MILLDTNVLSALVRPNPDVAVVRWLDRQAESSIWTTSITLIEIRYGLLIMPAGRRRDQMTEKIEAVLREEIGERYLALDVAAAEEAAKLMANRRSVGRPVDFRDTMIGGIALAAHATLATRNVAHFEDLNVPVVNPWES